MTATELCFLIVLTGLFLIVLLAYFSYKMAKHKKANDDLYYKENLRRIGK
jgi:hypothetical protein